MATSSNVSQGSTTIEVEISLKDCLAIQCEPFKERYMAILNLGANVKKVTLNVNDVARTVDNRRATWIGLYVVLGNNNHNDGKLVTIKPDRHNSSHSFGSNVTFGKCYLPDTLICANFKKSTGHEVKFILMMIDGNVLDRYFYCNSIQVPQATSFKVVGMKKETMSSTVYHELTYLQDSRFALVRPDKELGVMEVCRRTVRESPNNSKANLELWARLGDNGHNDRITHIQTMVAFFKGGKEAQIFIANALKPQNDTTMYYVYICCSRRTWDRNFEAFTHQLYYNVRIFMVGISIDHLDRFSTQINVMSTGGKRYFGLDDLADIDHTRQRNYKYILDKSRDYDGEIKMRFDNVRPGHEGIWHDRTFGFWNHFWLTQHGAKDNTQSSALWQQRYYHDFFIGNCSTNLAFSEQTDLAITSQKTVADIKQLKLLSTSSRLDEMFFSGLLPCLVRDDSNRKDCNQFQQHSTLILVKESDFVENGIVRYDVSELEEEAEVIGAEITSITNNGLLVDKFNDPGPIAIPVKRGLGRRLSPFEVAMRYDDYLNNFYFMADFDINAFPPRYCGVKGIPRTVRTYILSRKLLIRVVDNDQKPQFNRFIPRKYESNNKEHMGYKTITASDCPVWGTANDGNTSLRAYIALDGRGVRLDFIDEMVNETTDTRVFILCLDAESDHRLVGPVGFVPAKWVIFGVAAHHVRHCISKSSMPMFDTALSYPVVQFTDSRCYYSQRDTGERELHRQYPDPDVKKRKDDEPRGRKRPRTSDQTDQAGSSKDVGTYDEYRSSKKHDRSDKPSSVYYPSSGGQANDSMADGQDDLGNELESVQDEMKVDNWWPDVIAGIVGAVSGVVAGTYYLYIN